jgi:GntR family transcriptional repressor for pyruvate dehydrogenase complex
VNPDAPARRSPVQTLSEHLAQQVIDLIRSDELLPGSRLPSVKEMAGLFSVAPPTMREALRQLEITGIIDIRHGSGIYVLQNERPMMIANPYRGELERGTIADLFEARSVLEPALAEMAARNSDDGEIARLRTLIDTAEMYLAGDDSTDLKLGEINMQFHRGIAAGAKNSVLAQVMASISELHSKEHLAVLDLYNDRRRDHEQHKVILFAIESRDPQGARDAMAQHIADVWSVIQARL